MKQIFISILESKQNYAYNYNFLPHKTLSFLFLSTNVDILGNDQGNSAMGTLALSDTAIGSVKWDNGSNYYSVSST